MLLIQLKIYSNDVLLSVFSKILDNASAWVIFNTLNLIDWTSDPELWEWDWYWIKLIDFNDKNEDILNDSYEFLHDTFYWKYNDYVNLSI